MDIKKLIEEYQTKIDMLKLIESGYKGNITVKRRDDSVVTISPFEDHGYIGWKEVDQNSDLISLYEVDGRNITRSAFDVILRLD